MSELECKRDDGFAAEIELFQKNGAPFVVTGKDLLAQLRNREALLATIAISEVPSDDGNVVLVELTAAQTRALPVSDALNVLKFDVAVIDGTADPVRSQDFVLKVHDQQTERAV